MSLIISDRVVETSTSTGTGAITLAGAVTGYRAFSTVMSVGDVCFYTIEGIDGSNNPTGEWETGFGTYSAANTLTRTTVKDSSNSGSAVTFSAGTKRVFLNLVAAAIMRDPRPWMLGNVPVAASFTLASGDGNSATLTDDANVGLIFVGGTPVTSNINRAAEVSIPTPGADWTYSAHCRIMCPSSSFGGVGISCRDATGGKGYLYGYDNSGNLVVYRNQLGSYSSTPLNFNITGGHKPEWLRIHFINSTNTVEFWCSCDGKTWQRAYNETLSSWMVNAATKVGFTSQTNRTNAFQNVLTCDYWTLA